MMVGVNVDVENPYDGALYLSQYAYQGYDYLASVLGELAPAPAPPLSVPTPDNTAAQPLTDKPALAQLSDDSQPTQDNSGGAAEVVQAVMQTVADGEANASKATAAQQLGQPVGWPFDYTDTRTGKTYRNGQVVQDDRQSLVDFFLTPEQQRQQQVKDMLRAEYAGVRFPLSEIETLAASPDSGIRLVPNTHPIETIWNLRRGRHPAFA